MQLKCKKKWFIIIIGESHKTRLTFTHLPSVEGVSGEVIDLTSMAFSAITAKVDIKLKKCYNIDTLYDCCMFVIHLLILSVDK